MTQKQTASQPVRAAALICEYNPFHNGHAAQLAMLRRAYPDAAILCIQSGSFVQRGDAAIFPAPLRAHAALLHGADAVFSLPAAYSLASAERFACAGVESAAHLGAEVLAFGAETPQLDRLCTVSERLHSDAFEAALQKSLRQSPSLGYPARRSAVYAALYGTQDLPVLTAPNNILAFEYLRAAKMHGIAAIALPRIGAAHDAPAKEAPPQSDICSATALRDAIHKGGTLFGAPPDCLAIYKDALARGYNASLVRGGAAILYALSCADEKTLQGISDMPPDMAPRLRAAAAKSDSLPQFFAAAAHRKYTAARVRRISLCAVLGISDAMAHAPVPYLNLLGATPRGIAYLHAQGHLFSVPVLTKQAHIRRLDAKAQQQYAVTARAERLYRLMQSTPSPAPVLKRDTNGILYYQYP